MLMSIHSLMENRMRTTRLVYLHKPNERCACERQINFFLRHLKSSRMKSICLQHCIFGVGEGVIFPRILAVDGSTPLSLINEKKKTKISLKNSSLRQVCVKKNILSNTVDGETAASALLFRQCYAAF